MSNISLTRRENRIKFLRKELRKMKKKHWPFIDKYYKQEILPIIESLKGNSIIESLELPFQKNIF